MLQKSKTEAPKYRTLNISIAVLAVVIIVLIARSCTPDAKKAPIIVTPDPEVIAKYRDANTKPAGIDVWACDGVCPLTENGHTLTVSDVPSNVTPYFVPISGEADIQQLNALKREGFRCLNTILGNLTFYDKNTNELVDNFKKPVTIKLDYTYADLAAVKECGSTFEGKELSNDLVPAYLFMSPEDVNINIWKPFSNYKVEPREYDATAAPETIAGTISIEFSFWGDRPIIGGSPKE